MPELGRDAGTWLVVIVSVAGALALPVLARWRLTPAIIREHYELWRPGWAITTTVLSMGVLTVTGAAVALAALSYPFLWSTVAIVASGLAVQVDYLVRYCAAARAYEGRQHDE